MVIVSPICGRHRVRSNAPPGVTWFKFMLDHRIRENADRHDWVSERWTRLLELRAPLTGFLPELVSVIPTN